MNGWRATAERQYGVVTRAQLRESLTDRQIHPLLGRDLERMFSGVFRVAGSYPSARQRAMAACLWCGTTALLSHSTGASLLRLSAVSELLHVSTDETVRRRHPDVVVHRSTFASRDRIVVDGLPCTSGTRTIIDLASVLDGEALEDTFEKARRLGLTTKTVLERRVNEVCGQGRPGSTQLRELLRVVAARPKESKLEVKTARLLRANRIEPDAAQLRVERFRLDFAWPRLLFAVECHGFEWHGNRLAWKRDRRRIARLESLGWRLLHVTWDDVTQRPSETLDRICMAIRLSTGEQ
jgi:very-short-patch-repair endonuclease